MTGKIDALIHTLLDPTARDDERDDAAMDLGRFDDDRALIVLLQVASNLDEDRMILDSCGESIAEIWVRKGQFDFDSYQKMALIARHEAYRYIKGMKQEWVEQYSLKLS